MNRTVTVVVLLGLLVAGFFFKAPLEEIHLPAGKLVGPITNTILATWVTMLALIGLFYAATKGFNAAKMSLVPRGVQNFVEFGVEALLNFVTGVAGEEKGRKFFPLIATIFLFVITNAWLGLLPGFLTIGVIKAPEPGQHAEHFQPVTSGVAVVPFGGGSEPKEKAAAGHEAEAGGLAGTFTPLLRAANTDLNTTLALALIAMFFVEMWGLQALGLGYLGKFINFSGPIALFVGLLELVSEFARVVSFTFRLFGNMFAGEVLLGVISFLVPWVMVLPFFGLEIFVGFVQALVFAGLTLVFSVMATAGHGEEHHEEAHAEAAAAHH